MLTAIFWKPEFLWYVQEIWVLKPIWHISLVRNKVNNRIPIDSALKPDYAYYADQDRAQRHTLALRDVAYLGYLSYEALMLSLVSGAEIATN